jgi:hypothetical protein
MINMAGFDLGAYEAPENKEKVFLTPGFRKLKVVKFAYTKEEEGKTPLIVMEATHIDKEGNTVETNQDFYLSGKLNKKGVMTGLLRVLELVRGLTGEKKINAQAENYTYIKKETNGTTESYTIPDPQIICDYLNKKCAGKAAIFRVGGEENDEGKVFTKLDYTGFLYSVDKAGNLCLYKEERDFTKSEYSYSVRKKKNEGAPAHGGGMADPGKLDEL